MTNILYRNSTTATVPAATSAKGSALTWDELDGNFKALAYDVKVAMPANDINLANGVYFTKTISGATTLTVSNVIASGAVNSFMLDMTNGGSAVITWWSGMKWASGAAPTFTAAGRDLLGFTSHDGGTTWNGLLLGKDIK
jgi:hypothetical protein